MINPFKNKRGLGRGLSSLIGDNNINKDTNKVSISSIVPNKFQPRKKFDNLDLEELANSIKERGIIQPIIVRASIEENEKYEIVAGERRWQAAQRAGLHEVPVIITDIDNLKSLEFAIVENVQRKDLNIIEEANGYKKLIDEFNYDQYKVSKFIGKSRSHISNCLRLLSLSEKIQKYIIEGNLSYGHAKVLVGLENADLLAEKVLKKKLSVRQTEKLIRTLKSTRNHSSIKRDINIINLENEIAEKIGLKVYLKNKKDNSGTFIIEYKDLDQLQRITKVIKDNY